MSILLNTICIFLIGLFYIHYVVFFLFSKFLLKLLITLKILIFFQMIRKEKKNFCISIVPFFFSTFGLSILIIFYIVIGGIIFQYIESDNEKEQNEKYREIERSTEILIEQIWNMTNSEIIFSDKIYVFQLKIKLAHHKSKYLEALSKGNYILIIIFI